MAEKKSELMSLMIASLTDEQLKSFVSSLTGNTREIVDGIVENYENAIHKIESWYDNLVKSVMIEHRTETAHFRDDADKYELILHETFDGTPVVHLYRRDELRK